MFLIISILTLFLVMTSTTLNIRVLDNICNLSMFIFQKTSPVHNDEEPIAMSMPDSVFEMATKIGEEVIIF